MSDIGFFGNLFNFGRLIRYLPEPGSGTAGAFGQILSSITKATAPVEGGGVDNQLANLMSEQLAQQERLQMVSLYSNVAKSEHETQMAPIRNIRVG